MPFSISTKTDKFIFIAFSKFLFNLTFSVKMWMWVRFKLWRTFGRETLALFITIYKSDQNGMYFLFKCRYFLITLACPGYLEISPVLASTGWLHFFKIAQQLNLSFKILMTKSLFVCLFVCLYQLYPFSS